MEGLTTHPFVLKNIYPRQYENMNQSHNKILVTRLTTKTIYGEMSIIKTIIQHFRTIHRVNRYGIPSCNPYLKPSYKEVSYQWKDVNCKLCVEFGMRINGKTKSLKLKYKELRGKDAKVLDNLRHENVNNTRLLFGKKPR